MYVNAIIVDANYYVWPLQACKQGEQFVAPGTCKSTCPYTWKTVQDWEREANDPTPELTDALENGANSHGLLTPAAQRAQQCFVGKYSAALGTSPTITAEFRTDAYQLHLRDIWDKWNALNTEAPEVQAACVDVKARLDAEMGRRSIDGACTLPGRNHCLVHRPAGANGRHTQGTAFDVSHANVDSLMQYLQSGPTPTSMEQFLNFQSPICNLNWGWTLFGDRVHFQLR